ncbi:hypothetical protein COU95_01635 [Candidatus Shapirobacteria bacterium CG10_big_fil_rev_8_21_14_0_10_40_9]|uniref:Uncharacterized protein n=1 Tax=Candidatus Shapirobacteria bacterium CG10_big_fil_rev_8_21_14_0_10_40_9 TaxID=1974888 RepID=A0A2M8L3R9_9BACT|nr:MAG: hypothetical protein COU95_01635 [Candidatus Shapirobacteria bacterium CG10_big_fil_rev_8_21_14_0_10_40_9]
MLTQKDFDEIEKIVDKELEEKIKFLPTKDEFYGKMDELMGEVKAIREEQAVISGYKDKLENHETRIIKLEETSPL